MVPWKISALLEKATLGKNDLLKFLKIRMSYCSLQPVTWQLNKLIQMVYTSGVILELFVEVLSHNKSLSNAVISGPALIQLTQILQMFIKAIFYGSTERTN